ncbi:uncharacterized protein UV8b_07695 [Ustilaginoidea virens]|uniref:Integral membrane protein n=1 Tax=Ustilaginoidea virens TaxID=1159556 RepID=A0A063BZD3_USTVR|nr:uncharacterized protein UV8b_07695 [Ustilaginoidea virens]QUC23454.1 hypothetical protein UV8b_07695 [Ustilaginoidea virens]GAO18009.1 hypothetical protein UVI_02060310 [Ustilaginoidea virens]
MIDLAAVYLGVFIGVFPITMSKIIRQTRKIVLQSRTYQNAYLYMIWIEAIVNLVFTIITYLYLIKIIPGSLGFYLGTAGLWAIQTQLLSQIIANRVGLIMVNKKKVKMMKLGLAGAILCVNIAVAVIWPAAYDDHATPAQIELNNIFEKAEKSFFLVVDLGLNMTFLYMVRFRLIAQGLHKYWKLFNYNIAIVGVSTAMDAALLGMLSLPNPYLYVQFAPVVYIVKLNIELTMASLIAKIVKRSVNHRQFNNHQSSRNKGRMYAKVQDPSGCVVTSSSNGNPSDTYGNDVEIQKEGNESNIPLAYFPGEAGIMRTVTTTVITEANREDRLNT